MQSVNIGSKYESISQIGLARLIPSLGVQKERPMEYDEEEVLARYVWRHCRHLMTEIERRADLAGMAEIKAAAAEERGSTSLAREVTQRWGSAGDIEVRMALGDGFEAFRQRVTYRLLADPAVQAMIKRCPECGRVVRTPQARQCLWCKHVWRGRDA
jgi:hypothetical protein